MNEQSIKAKIEARQEQARQAITAESWQEFPDSEKIVDAAIRGGLGADEADGIVSQIEQAKTTIAELGQIDLAALKATAAKADAEREKKAAAFSKAQEAFEQASETAETAQTAFDAAMQRFRDASNQARGGSLPSDRLPEVVLKIMAFDQAVDHAQRYNSERAQDGIERDRLRGAVAALTEARKTAADHKAAGFKSVDITGGGLAESGPKVEKRLRDARQQLKAVEKKIAGHAQEEARRGRALEEARSAIFG